MPRERKILDRLARVADLQDEPFPGQPIVEVVGTARVLIENQKGVLEYGDSAVRIRMKYGSLCILGSNLEFARMTKQQLVVVGCIEKVQLERGL